MRVLPNILVVGTPGVGKSSLCQQLADRLNMEYVDVGEFAKEHDCLEGYDNTYQCPILDEDMVVEELEAQVLEGGKILEYHSSDFFPKDWFDIIFVLQAKTECLYDRLVKRGYSGKKLEDNMQCEIFQTPLEEAKEAFGKLVHCLPSNTCDEMEENLTNIEDWVSKWKITATSVAS